MVLWELGLVGELAGDGDPVGGVEGREGVGEAVGGLEVGEVDGDAEVDDAVAQDVDGAPVVEFGGQPLGEPALGGGRGRCRSGRGALPTRWAGWPR